MIFPLKHGEKDGKNCDFPMEKSVTTNMKNMG